MKELMNIKVYVFQLRYNGSSLESLDGISCMSYDQVIKNFDGNTPEEIKDLEIQIRSGDTARVFVESDDGYTYMYSMSINEDRIIGEKEGLLFGYKFGRAKFL